MSTSARPDTPRTIRVTSSHQNSSLEEQREAVLDDTKHKIEVQLAEFINTFVPNLPMGLTMNDIKQRMDKRRAWKDFSSAPANQQGIEDVVLKDLTPLFDEMVKTVESFTNSRKRGVQCNDGPSSQLPEARQPQPEDHQPSNRIRSFTAKGFLIPNRTHATTLLLLRSSRKLPASPISLM